MSAPIVWRSTVFPSPDAQKISTSRPPSWAASRIAWRQPPHGRDRACARQFVARSVAARDRDSRDLVQPEGRLGEGQRTDFGAQAKPVTGIFHIRAGDDHAIDALDRAADREAGIGGVGLEGGGAGGGDEVGVGHLQVIRLAIRQAAMAWRSADAPLVRFCPASAGRGLHHAAASAATAAAARTGTDPQPRRDGRGADPRAQRFPRQSRTAAAERSGGGRAGAGGRGGLSRVGAQEQADRQ